MHSLLRIGVFSCATFFIFIWAGGAEAHGGKVLGAEDAKSSINELQLLTSELENSVRNSPAVQSAPSSAARAMAPSAETSSVVAAPTTPTHDRILDLAQRRAELMLKLAEESPEDFLKNVIPESSRRMFSSQVQNEIEQKVTKTGILQVLHSEDFKDTSEYSYHLISSGKEESLFLGGEPPLLSSGDQVAVEGYALGGAVVSAGGTGNVTVLATEAPESVGVQKTLVIPLTSAKVGSKKLYSKAQLKLLIFQGPYQDYFVEQSYGKVSFEGMVTDWISIPADDYPGWGCGSSLDITYPPILAYLKANAIDPGAYQRIVYLFSERGGGCSGVGKWDTYYEGRKLNISHAWVGMSLDGKGAYELYADGKLVSSSSAYEEYAFTACRVYAKANPKKQTRCLWNGTEIYTSLANNNWKEGLSYFSYVLAHEVGHSLGVYHGNALYCAGKTYYSNCEHVEYGNPVDVMGQGNQGGHFNGFYKKYLGWLVGGDVQTITKTGAYTLAPLEGKSGVRLAVIANPQSALDPLYVEFRQRIGFDQHLNAATEVGLYINEVVPGLASGAARLLNANQATRPAFYPPALVSGGKFSELGRAISVSSLVASTTQATYRVGVGTPVCKRYPFTTDINVDDREEIAAGRSATVSFDLINTDLPVCTDSNLTLSAAVSGAVGWGVSLDTNSFLSQPASSQGIYVNLTIPANATLGSHTISVTITDAANARTKVVKQVITVVAPPKILSVSPTKGKSGTPMTLVGSGFHPWSNVVAVTKADDPDFSTHLYQVEGSSDTLHFELPYVCTDPELEYGEECPSNEQVALPEGAYYISVFNESTGGLSNQVAFEVSEGGTFGVLTLTAPNGGEQWELSMQNSITWKPYSYNPMVNPSQDVTAYLDRLEADGTYRNMGKIIDGGKASIHWQGEIKQYGVYPAPGNKYFIRVVNTKTGETDRSDAAFTLLKRPVDLKVNGSQGPITVTDNQQLTLSWTTVNMTSCYLYGVRHISGGETEYGKSVPPVSTSTVVYADTTVGAVSIYCDRGTGSTAGDSVTITNASGSPALSSPPSLRVQSPNGGEKLTIGSPYTVSWEQSGLTSPSIALYQDDMWVKWLAKDTSEKSLTWTPGAEESALMSAGKVFKVYITADKIDGMGHLDDKSDGTFEFTTGGAVLGASTGPASLETRIVELRRLLDLLKQSLLSQH